MDRRLLGLLAVSEQTPTLPPRRLAFFCPGYNIRVSTPSAASESEQTSVDSARPFSLRQRVALWFISWAGHLAILLIGPTLRYSISWEEPPAELHAIYEKPVIYSFWHRAVFASSWLWRKTGIAVMVSRSFDGEYIARIIEMLGFKSIRGSSSRGGATALLGLKSHLAQDASVAFTIDGPRGPKYIAKPGPVLLARSTGFPMVAFFVALHDCWVVNTWDAFMIPKPFSKALVRFSTKIRVPADASDRQMEQLHRELQAALERVTQFAEANVGQVGSAEFPILER
jgi:lysophospholipid acyltransferase (LPLAT)-like uncharacterized protein